MAETGHALKVEMPYFDALASGDKTFEVRRNDRAFQRGDRLLLREWGPKPCGQKGCRESHGIGYTGRELERVVSFVYSGDPRWPALQPGYVVLALAEDTRP